MEVSFKCALGSESLLNVFRVKKGMFFQIKEDGAYYEFIVSPEDAILLSDDIIKSYKNKIQLTEGPYECAHGGGDELTLVKVEEGLFIELQEGGSNEFIVTHEDAELLAEKILKYYEENPEHAVT